MVLVGFTAGPIVPPLWLEIGSRRRLGLCSRLVRLIAAAHDHPYDMLASAALLGIGIGLAFAALGNLIVNAVAAHQTGAAGGMNTVMRTIGGALGGQLAATFIADHTGPGGLPTVTGFIETFWMATAFLVVCTVAGLLIPSSRAASTAFRAGKQERTRRTQPRRQLSRAAYSLVVEAAAERDSRSRPSGPSSRSRIFRAS
jgi:MFS family permease